MGSHQLSQNSHMLGHEDPLCKPNIEINMTSELLKKKEKWQQGFNSSNVRKQIRFKAPSSKLRIIPLVGLHINLVIVSSIPDSVETEQAITEQY